ncbi:acylhydrolase [Microcoleus sp. FACHB-SPT15]|uniref:GDSL-type esterase/lipase family protein n=1 Tax=Microcoleus sp. FACHB-SPT15 TaxID=2692830 RepID=UPI00177D9F60|nr:GDSL-type esterase/lipase family protein [Microcoleus sp. FACHB-SPT15]MBD1809182.1 acylhydrolase [Microcoleus sp. FACHB-SPT15]
MSDPCLLAASLLTAGPITVPPPIKLPPNLLDNLSALFASSTTQTLQAVAAQKVVPIVEVNSPEFSQSRPSPAILRTSATSQPVTAEAATTLVSNQQAVSTPQSMITPTSGSQLYLQRVAALKAGKLYTRLPSNSFESLWAKGTSTGTPLQQPTHEQWKLLLEQEAKAVAKGQGSNRLAILVGDSLSMWFPSQSLPYGQLWLNQGISGENSGQILKRLSAFAKTRPNTIYVMAGTNDLRQGASDRVILDNIRQIVRRLRSNHPQAQVVVQSILPTRLSAIPNQRIYNLNQQIAAIAQQEGTGFLNLYSLFADEQGQLQQDLTTDGIHLSHRGYQVWQEALNYADSVMVANRNGGIAQGLGTSD